VIEKPLQRFWLEILARRKENGEPSQQRPFIRTVTEQEFHHRNAATLRHSHERHVFDQELTKLGLGAQELLHGRDVIRHDRVLKPPPHI
jgi:hypothetical protein